MKGKSHHLLVGMFSEFGAQELVWGQVQALEASHDG